MLTAEHVEVVAFAALKHQHLISLDIKLLPKLLFHASEPAIVYNLDVELCKHAVWVVRILCPKIRFVVVYLLVSLAEEVIKPIPRHRLVLAKGLGDLVAYSVRVLFVGLSLTPPREEEATR